jgi:hypothetical protein
MSDDQPNKTSDKLSDIVVTALLGLVGAGFVTQGIGAILRQQTEWSSLRVFSVPSVAVLLGLIIFVAGLLWTRIRSRLPATLSDGLTRLAANAKTWVVMVMAVFLYNCLLQVRQNNEVAALRNDQQSIARVLDRIALPRHLSDRQVEIIADILQNFSAPKIALEVIQGDDEASDYRADIQRALEKGGWHVTSISQVVNTPEAQIPDFSIYYLPAPGHAQTGGATDFRHPSVVMGLREAFGLAGVGEISGSNDGGSGNVAQDTIKITIGHRRRGYSLLPCEAK